MHQPITIAVYRFWTDYTQAYKVEDGTHPQTGEPLRIRRILPGEKRPVHMVEYGPIGSDKSRITARVEELKSVRDPSEMQRNPSIAQAMQRWAAIEPYYEAWLKGQEPTAEGTPLDAWNGCSREQAELLKMKNVHTVQQLATLNDTHFEKFGIHGLRALTEMAKRFVATLDSQVLADELKARDEQIGDLRDTIDAMKGVMEEMRAALLATAPAPAPGDGGLPEQTGNAKAKRRAA